MCKIQQTMCKLQQTMCKLAYVEDIADILRCYCSVDYLQMTVLYKTLVI